MATAARIRPHAVQTAIVTGTTVRAAADEVARKVQAWARSVIAGMLRP
jgi:hypothetical protein